MTAYVHHVPGRLRVKIAAIKRDPGAAEALRCKLALLPGIHSVTANPVTGSVTICYRYAETDAESLWASLRRLGLIDEPGLPRHRDRPVFPDALFAVLAPRVVKLLAEAALEIVVSRSAVRLMTALL